MTKQNLLFLGWTAEKLKEYKQKEKEWGKSLWTYRNLNAGLYCKYKNWLKIIN